MRRFFLTVSAIGMVLTCSPLALVAGELDLLPLGDPERAFELGSGHPGEIIDSKTGDAISLESMVSTLASARVILIGEEHTHLGQKMFHAQLLDALAEIQPNLVLGMEFFRRSDEQALKQWGRGEIDDQALLRETGWYDRGTYRWGYYKEIMDVAKKRSIPVAGLNIPRDIPRTVNRQGLLALDDDQKALVGEVVVDNSPQHRFLVGRYFGDTVAMMPPNWFNNMYAAQCLWDTVMARSILDVLPQDGIVVVIVGAGHVAFDLGIERRIDEELAERGEEGIEVATFCPIQAPIPEVDSDQPAGHPMGGDREGDQSPQAVFVRSLADFVGVFEATGGVDAWPTLGLKLKEGDAGESVVSIAWPDSRAADAGFETGDIIVDFNGVEPESLPDLRMMMAGLEWGDRVDLGIVRGEERLNLAMLLVPDPVVEERQVAPGWTVEEVDDVIPESDSVVEAVENAPEPLTVLLSDGGSVKWVVVWLDGIAQELHILDDAGRVSRSKYLVPRSDGATEVVFHRVGQGQASSSDRLARDGRVVAP